ncbi:MAG: hypothetical protein ACO25F_11705 [Erythrobacter sp.]
MSRFGSLAFATLAAIGAACAPLSAQEAGPAPSGDSANPLCTFHGEGCSAPPAEWTWQRLEPEVGVFSVELPCDERQADAFGQVLAISQASLPVGSTRACMKASSGFTAVLIGLAALPDDTKSPETDRLLGGAPDLFTALSKQNSENPVPEVTFKGRRSMIKTVEKEAARTKIAVIEVKRLALIMLIADIRADFPGTREEADTAADRFFNSLEIAE